jgi:hypothetical protein
MLTTFGTSAHLVEAISIAAVVAPFPASERVGA